MPTVGVRVRAADSVHSNESSCAGQLRASHDPLRMLLFLLTLVTISRVHDSIPAIARLRPALVLTGLVAGYAFMNRRALRAGGLLDAWPPKVMLGMLVFACIGAPFGISLGSSGLFILDSYAKTMVFAFLLLAAVRDARDLYLFVWAFVISSALLVVVSLVVYQTFEYGDYARLAGMGSYDANDIGCVLIVGLCLTILTFQVTSGWQKALSAATLLGIGATIARSGSRGTLVGLVVVGVALLVLSHNVPVVKRVAFVAILVVGLAVASPPGYWRQMSTILDPKEDYNWSSTDGRRQLIERGVGYMLAYPLFGLGINNFTKAECTISEKATSGVLGRGVRCTPPHNSTVQAGAELGFPGLALWLTLLGGGIVGMLRLRKRIPTSWLRGSQEQRFLALAPLYCGLAMLGFATTSFFVSFAWLDLAYALSALIASVYVVVEGRLPKTRGPASAAAVRSGVVPRT